VTVATRFPARVYREGQEPDPRFSLANERTFLAWLRTALALLAAGVALEALKIPDEPVLRFAAAGVFIALGVAAAIRSWLGWMRAERALRRSEPLPGIPFGAVLVTGVAIGGVLVAVGLVR
jgi:putative membrane protein